MVDVTQVGTAPKLKKNKNIVWLIYHLCQLCAPTLLGKLALINLPYFAVQLQECVCASLLGNIYGTVEVPWVDHVPWVDWNKHKSAICQYFYQNVTINLTQ